MSQGRLSPNSPLEDDGRIQNYKQKQSKDFFSETRSTAQVNAMQTEAGIVSVCLLALGLQVRRKLHTLLLAFHGLLAEGSVDSRDCSSLIFKYTVRTSWCFLQHNGLTKKSKLVDAGIVMPTYSLNT